MSNECIITYIDRIYRIHTQVSTQTFVQMLYMCAFSTLANCRLHERHACYPPRTAVGAEAARKACISSMPVDLRGAARQGPHAACISACSLSSLLQSKSRAQPMNNARLCEKPARSAVHQGQPAHAGFGSRRRKSRPQQRRWRGSPEAQRPSNGH